MSEPKRILKLPDVAIPSGARTVPRYPLVYSPASSTQVNVARLPAAEALTGMSLAYREQTMSDAALRRWTALRLLAFLLVAPAAAYYMLLVGPVIPAQWALGVTAAGGFLCALILILLRYRNLKRILLILFGPVAVTICGWGISSILQTVSRYQAVLGLSLITVMALYLTERIAWPLHFYREFLFTHPRLTPETRERRFRRIPILAAFVGAAISVAILFTLLTEDPVLGTVTALLVGLIIVLLLIMGLTISTNSEAEIRRIWELSKRKMHAPAAVKDAVKLRNSSLVWRFVVLIFVAFISTTYLGADGENFRGGVLLVAFVWCCITVWPTIRRATAFFGPYLSYSGTASGAAGVWTPRVSTLRRQWLLGGTSVLFCLTLFVSLAMFFPTSKGSSVSIASISGWPRFSFEWPIFASAVHGDLKFKQGLIYAGLLDLPDARQLFGNLFATFIVLVPLSAFAMFLALFEGPLEQAEKLRVTIEGKEMPYAQRKLLEADRWFGQYVKLLFRWVWFLVQAAGYYIGDALRLSKLGIKIPYPAEPDFILPESTSGRTPGLDEDGRTEWQWHVDRLRMSDHQATDPVSGAPVYEAGHLFLGIEPHRNFPILLDKRLLAEHCYIMGDSGSGKTSLGIMPLVIQIIRGNKDPRHIALENQLNSFRWRAQAHQLLAAKAEVLKKVERYREWREKNLGNLQPAQRELERLTRTGGDPQKIADWQRYISELLAPGPEEASDQNKLDLLKLALASLLKEVGVQESELDALLGGLDAQIVSDPSPVVILDLKGDAALFHSVKAEAEARGQKFLFFTPEKNRDTHRFNPFHDFDSESRSDAQLCQLFLDALSLNHGAGYGTGYFSLRSRTLLYRALQETTPGGSKPRSFPELWEVLERFGEEMGSSDDYRDAFELVGTIQALAKCKALTDDPNIPAISMPTVIEQGQVVYFWLPAAIESVTAQEIGKLAVYSLLSAAIDRQRKQSELPPAQRSTRQVYLIIDEFQRLAGDNFRIILEQARSFGIAAILSNQSIADLQTSETDLRPTVRTNTRVKMFFSVTDPEEAETLSALSGEEVVEERSHSINYNLAESRFLPHSQSVSLRDVTKRRLSVGDIQAYSDHPNDFILHVSRGSGYTQFGGLPVPVRTAWPIPFPLYQRRTVALWPSIESGEGITNQQGPKDIEQEQRIETERHEQEALKRMFKKRSPARVDPGPASA